MFKKNILTGLLVLIPIVLTLWVLVTLTQFLDQVLLFLPKEVQPDIFFGGAIPGYGVIVTLIVVFLTGVIANNFFGKKIITTSTDIANVRLEFSGGSVANLTASRISQKNERKIRVFEKDKYYSVDFMNSNIKKYIKNSKTSKELFSFKEFKYDKTYALKDEIDNFILSCLGKQKPLVDGKQGKAAVETATLISKLL